MHKTKLSSKHQIVIPKEVRRQLHLKAGMFVSIQPIDEEHALVTKRAVNHVDALCGLGKEVWKQLDGADHYLAQERAAWNK